MLILRFAGPEGAKNLAGKCPPPDSDPLNDASLEKISPACQDNSPQCKSPIRVPEKPSTFHPRENAQLEFIVAAVYLSRL
jgi:hypothetical protein